MFFQVIKVIFFNLLLFEVLLRAIGFSMYTLQISNTFLETGKQGEARILVLGESTSERQAGVDWPTQLGEIAKKETDIPVKIINVAEAGTDTNYLARDLESHIRKYNPHIVISMMGVNDGVRNWFFEKGLTRNSNFFLNLRIVKFFKAILFSTIREPETEPAPPSIYDYFEVELPKPLLAAIKKKSYREAKAQLAEFLEGRDESFKTQSYRTLLYLLNTKFSENYETYENEFLLAEAEMELYEGVKDFLVKNHWVAIHMLPPICDANHGDKELYKQIARNYLNHPAAPIDNVMLKRLSQCLPPEDPDLQDFMKTFAPGMNFAERRSATADNYRYIYDVLVSNRICWIIVQYPLLDIQQRKDYFTEEQQKNPLLRFVSNNENFKEALKQHKFDDLFIDNFGGVFGHATEKGNFLIANNAFTFLQEALMDKNCFNR